MDGKKKELPVVYVCSPYSGDVEANVTAARRYSRFTLFYGALPMTPHLLYPQFMDDTEPEEREMALHICLYWLDKCEELWIFGDVITSGMNREIAFAKKAGKRIRHFSTNCIPKGEEAYDYDG